MKQHPEGWVIEGWAIENQFDPADGEGDLFSFVTPQDPNDAPGAEPDFWATPRVGWVRATLILKTGE